MNLKNIMDLINPEKQRAKRERSYLNGSVSLHDLERRQREIERGSFR